VTYRKDYCEGPFGQIHFVEEGDGPPVILLHQMVWSSRQFDNALPVLSARGLRAIAIDLPGFGNSDGPDKPPGAEGYASVVLPVMEHLGLDVSAVCGHHTGASVACAFGHAHPKRVSKLVLHGCPLLTSQEQKDRLSRPHFDQTPRTTGNHFKMLWDTIYGATKGEASLQATHLGVLLTFLAGEKEWFGHHAAFSYDMEKAISELKPSALVISNTGDTLHAADKKVILIRPDFGYAEMPGGTYHVVFDEAEAWANIVADYVLGKAP